MVSETEQLSRRLVDDKWDKQRTDLQLPMEVAANQRINQRDGPLHSLSVRNPPWTVSIRAFNQSSKADQAS